MIISAYIEKINNSFPNTCYIDIGKPEFKKTEANTYEYE